MEYGIIYFKGDAIKILTPNGEFSYKTKKDFVKALKTYDELFIKTNKMEPLHKWLEVKKPIVTIKNNSLSSTQKTHFRVGKTWIRSMKYYLGSDKLTPEQGLLCYKHHSHWKQGYTQTIREQLGEALSPYKITEKALRDKLRSMVPTDPFLYSVNDVEFKNIQRWDGRKQYPALYCGKLPVNPVEIKTSEIVDDPRYVHLIRVQLTRVVPCRSEYYPLGITKDAEKEKGNKFIRSGNRIIGTRDEWYSFWCWREETIPVIKANYSCKMIIPKGRCWRFELKEVPELQETFYDLIKLEEEMKGDKAGIKQMRNRLHGFFGMDYLFNGSDKYNGTYRHWFTYVIAKQLNTMDQLAHMIGFKNIISGHTDSLYVRKDAKNIIQQFNDTINLPYGIGKFKEEHFALRIERYSSTKAKLETKEDGLTLIHGGIPDEAVEDFLEDKTYDDITRDSQMYVPTDWEIQEDEWGIDLVPIKGCFISLGQIIDDNEYVYR